MLTRARADTALDDALKALFPRVEAGVVDSKLASEDLPVVSWDMLGGVTQEPVSKRGRGVLQSLSYRIDFIDEDRATAYACADKAHQALAKWAPQYAGGGRPVGTNMYAATLSVTIRSI